MRLGEGDIPKGMIDMATRAPLRMRYLPGSGDRLVVAISGVGTSRGQEPPIEFYGSASEGGRNHVLFVTDRSRSWLTAPGMAEQIVDAALGISSRLGAACEIVLLGNSMGATMALHLSGILPARAVLAISPQFSGHMHVVPEETRWTFFRRQLAPGRFERLDEIDAEGRLVAILHGDAPEEAIHLERFPATAGLRHFVMPGEGHNLAKRLKRSGHMGDVVGAVLAGRPKVLDRRLRAAGFVRRDEAAPALPLAA